MVDVSYYVTDALTDAYVADIELYGVYATRQLNTAGNFTGTAKLTGDRIQDMLTLQATEPGRNVIHVRRAGVVIWAGFIWSRTYNPQSQALQLSGQTFESYFDHVVFAKNHLIQQKVNQELIFQNAVNQLQADEVNVGFTFATLPTSNIKRTVLIPNYEFHFAMDAIEQLVGIDNGLEYTIGPDKVIHLGYPELGNPSATDIGFDFPGGISNYWYPESGANGGVKFAALGYGSGNKIARATATRQDLLDDGYPGWWIVRQYSTIADTTLLQDKVAKDSFKYGMPFSSPTFELKPEVIPGFNAWDRLGDRFLAHIDDVRFPGGIDITSRLMGWEWNPSSSDGPELLRLQIDGSDV